MIHAQMNWQKISTPTKGSVELKIDLAKNLKAEKVIFMLGKKILGQGKIQKQTASFIWDTKKAKDGVYQIHVEAMMGKGKKISSKSISITVDNTGPALKWIEKPTKPLKILKCIAEVTDVSGVKKVEYRLPKYSPVLTNQKSRWQALWKNLPSGKFEIVLLATDNLGNQTQSKFTAIVDKEAPSLEWIFPTKAEMSAKPIPLQIKAVDASKIKKVWAIDNQDKKSEILFSEGKKKSFWNAVWKKPGKFVLQVHAEDDLGNTSKNSTLIVIYDNSLPYAKISLEEKKYFTKPFVLKLEAKDDVSGLAKVEFLLNDQKVQGKEVENTYTIPFDLKSGVYTFKCLLVDNVGNKNALLRKLQVDRKAPDVKILSPAPYIFRNQLRLKLAVKDDLSGVGQVQIFLQKKRIYEAKKISLKEIEFLYDGKDLKEGKYPLVAKIKDKAGNVQEKTLAHLVFDKTPPKADVWMAVNWKIGMKDLKVYFRDSSGINLKKAPKIYLMLKGKKYLPFKIDEFSEKSCQLRFLVTESFPLGKGKVFIEGVEDKVGNILPKTLLGEIKICTEKNIWPVESKKLFRIYSKGVAPKDSAIWIQVSAKQKVRAIESGKIIAISSSFNSAGYVHIQELRSRHIWKYHHLNIGKNPENRRYWTLGDTVSIGDSLGYTTKNFLYLGLVSKEKEKWISVSPLKFLPKEKPEYVNAVPEISASVPFFPQFVTPEAPKEEKKFGSTDFLLIIYVFLVVITLVSIAKWSKTPKLK